MSQLQQQYLDAMGITVWQRRVMPQPTVAEAPTPACQEIDAGVQDSLPLAKMDSAALQDAITHCQQCRLHCQPVPSLFASGNPQAPLMVIGEGYGEVEARQGSLLAGEQGALLAEMLAAIGLGVSQVYYTELLKCRSAGLSPTATEATACVGFLHRQIALSNAKCLLVLGEQAAQLLLGSEQPLDTLRQQSLQYGERQLPMQVSFSTAQLLQAPINKRYAWQDLCHLRATLSQLS